MFKTQTQLIHKSTTLEFLPGVTDFELGTALKLVAGVLTLAKGADIPVFICYGTKTPNGIPVERITKLTEYEADSASTADLKVGDDMALSPDGFSLVKSVDASKGIFTVSAIVADTLVRGYFK